MRKFVLAMLLVALCIFASGASAQPPPVFCGDLSADDCAILEASAAAMGEVSSATADFTLDLSMTGIPDAPGDININLSGDATWAGDVKALAGMSEPSPEQMQDPAAMMAMAGEALGAINAELNLSLSVPEELAAEMGDFPGQIDLQLRLVDGIGYVNFDTLAPLLAASPQAAMLTGWGGLDLVDALEQMGPMMSGMMEGGQMPPMGGGEPPALGDAMEGVTITREADADGGAVFVTNIDAAAMMKNPIFQEQMRSQMQAQGQAMTEEEFTALMDALTSNPDAMSMTSSSVIDLETSLVRSSSVEINIDLAAFAAMAGEDSAEAADALANASFAIIGEVNFDNYNAAPEVTVPDGATVITMEQFFTFLMTGTLTPES